MTTWSVDSGTLQYYLNSVVQSGDTLALAPGTYSGLAFKNLSFAQGVTITSADPSHQAVLTPFDVTNVTGLTVSNVELSAAGPIGIWQFNVKNSSDIHFDHVSVHGSLDGDASNDANGILFTGTSNVSVTNSEFTQLGRASLAVLQSSNIRIEGNTVHDIRTDAFDFAQVDHISISGNSFTNFHPVTGDHSDAIQIWTAATTAPSHDITISGNVVTKGDGEGMQGIFMRDADGTFSFQNVTITNNLMYGTQFNGITVYYANNLILSGNQLLAEPGKALESRMIIHTSDNVTLVGNDVGRFVFDHDTNLTESGDTVNPGVTDLGAAAMQVFALHHPETAALLAPFSPAPVDPGPATLPAIPAFTPMDFDFMHGAPMTGPLDFWQ